MLFRAVAIAALLIVGLIARADDSLGPLLQQLEGDDWAKRQSAEDAIVQVGPDALPEIATALRAAKNAEVVERLETAQKRIKQNAQLFGTVVDTSQDFRSPADAFAALASAAKVKLVYNNDDARRAAEKPSPVRFARRKTLLLQAFDELTSTSRTMCQLYRDQLIVTNYPYKERPPAIYAGSLAMRLQTVPRRSSQNRDDPDANGLNIAISLNTEPKAKIAGNEIMLRINAIEDEAGRAVVVEGSKQIALRGTGTNFAGTIPLKWVDPHPKRIHKVEVSLAAVSITSQREFVIDDLAWLPQSVDYGDMEVGISTGRDDAGRIQFMLKFEGPMAVDRRHGVEIRQLDDSVWLPANGFVVTDANGESIELEKRSSVGVNNWPVVTFTLIGQNARPARLIWRPIDQTTKMDVDFTFADIELP